jgi:hypothetical protein
LDTTDVITTTGGVVAWRIKGGFASDRTRVSDATVFTDAQFRAELAKIEAELVAQGKPLRSLALQEHMQERQARRVSAPRLTVEDVHMIRARVPEGATWGHATIQAIAVELGVQPETVLRCARRHTHARVK